jgi:hypothetical protein
LALVRRTARFCSNRLRLSWRKQSEYVLPISNNPHGAVDGQKFGVERPTVKARHSRKYFGRGKGVVAYTLLCNESAKKSGVGRSE